MVSGSSSSTPGRPTTPISGPTLQPPHTPSQQSIPAPPAPSPYSATMAMLRVNRIDRENLEHEKAAMEKRVADLRERDNAIEVLGREFEDPDTKATVDDDLMGKLVDWLRDAELQQAQGGEKEKRIQDLENMVTELREALEDRQQLHGPNPNASTASSSTLSTFSQPSVKTSSPPPLSSSPSSSVPFTIRRGGGEANELPIPILIRETAKLGQLVPLSALTRSALNEYIASPPTAVKLELQGRRVSIASLQCKRSAKLSLEDLRYAAR
ncbi:hypothetical protein M407DRAFT_12893, partial [Tulasnella calospora MUT 4182]